VIDGATDSVDTWIGRVLREGIKPLR